MPTDHSGDQQAAPTPRELIERARRAALLMGNSFTTPEDIGAQFAYLIDALDPVLATVERLEAAEKSRTVDKPTASPPVPPSPPAAQLQVGDCAFERTNRTSSGWRIVGSTRLADLEGPVGPVLAAVLDEIARLRARLADGVKGKVKHVTLAEHLNNTGRSPFVEMAQLLVLNTPVLVLPDEPEGQG